MSDPRNLPVEAPRVVYDRYGFLSTDPRATPSPCDKSKAREAARVVNRRLKKWQTMLSDWETFLNRKSGKLKERIRKGIPDGIRGIAWQRLARSAELPGKFPGVYDSLVHSTEGSMDEVIERDINRTFPAHVIFRGAGSQGQASLFNVLKAYSVYDEHVGYCQGMGFVTALFLMYMPEQEAFWMLVQFMKNYSYNALFAPGLPQLQVCLFQFEALFKELIPNLHAHFEKENIPVSMYASQWFLTLFLYSLPFDIALRVWDCFLYDGIKIIFRVGLAMLKLESQSFLEKDFEGILGLFSDYPREKLSPEVLLPCAFSFQFTRQRLAELETEYQSSMQEQKK